MWPGLGRKLFARFLADATSRQIPLSDKEFFNFYFDTLSVNILLYEVVIPKLELQTLTFCVRWFGIIGLNGRQSVVGGLRTTKAQTSVAFVIRLIDSIISRYLTSWLSFLVSTVSLSLSHWYPGSGMVLDCIDS